MLDLPVARVARLGVSYPTRDGPVRAVEDLSFDIFAGETLCLVGGSGSGKSVTSLALMRLVEFDGGEIVGGRILLQTEAGGCVDLAACSQRVMRAIRGRQIGMIFQEPMTALNPVFTVERQLTEAVRAHERTDAGRARARALELLRQVRLSEPERRLRQYPHELSGGMRQRVMIAMAMACRPRLLIADEPTTALDVTLQAEILDLIDRLRRETGMAVLFITHDMAVVARIADRVVVMQEGRAVEEGPVRQILRAPQHSYTKALLAAVPRLGDAPGAVAPPAEAPPLLDVRGLSCRFAVRGGLWQRRRGQVHAVEDVSFSLGRGRTLALVGESGCGKSTVARAVLRLVEPHAGQVQLDGADILAMGPGDLRRARRDMQMVFQDPFASLDPRMEVAAQVAEPLRNYEPLGRAAIADRVASLFDRVGLERALLRRYPHELSGGQRQRVAIARALALRPRLIVADEPVSALDTAVQAQVLALMTDLQADLGLSYLFISHDMAVVERISHEIAVMYLGRIVERGPSAAVLGDPRHAYTRALLRAVPKVDAARPAPAAAPHFRPVPSPIHPLAFRPGPSLYEEVGPGHFVLISESEY